jgi:hypothetical protein
VERRRGDRGCRGEVQDASDVNFDLELAAH